MILYYNPSIRSIWSWFIYLSVFACFRFLFNCSRRQPVPGQPPGIQSRKVKILNNLSHSHVFKPASQITIYCRWFCQKAFGVLSCWKSLKNIPYGQSSAKLPVTQLFGHLVTQSLGHSVTQSLGHLVTWSPRA